MQNHLGQKRLSPIEYGHIFGLMTAANPQPELRYTNMFSEIDLDDDSKPSAPLAPNQVQPLFTFGKNLNKNKYEDGEIGKFGIANHLTEIPEKNTEQINKMSQFKPNGRTGAIQNHHFFQQNDEKLGIPQKKLGSNLIMSVTKPGEIIDESVGSLEQSEIIQDEKSSENSHFIDVEFSEDESVQNKLIPQQKDEEVYSVKVSKYERVNQKQHNNKNQPQLLTYKGPSNPKESKNNKNSYQSTSTFSFKKDDNVAILAEIKEKPMANQGSDHIFIREDNHMSYKLKKTDPLPAQNAPARMKHSQGGLKKKTEKTEEDVSIKKYSEPTNFVSNSKKASHQPQFSVDIDHKMVQSPQYHISEVLLNKISNLEKVVSSLKSSEERSQQKHKFENEEKQIVEEQRIINPKAYFQNTREKIENEKGLKHGYQFLNESRPEDKSASEFEKEEIISKHNSKKNIGGRISDSNKSTKQLKTQNKRILAELEQVKELLNKKLSEKQTYANLQRESTRKIQKSSQQGYLKEKKTSARFIDHRPEIRNEIRFKKNAGPEKVIQSKDHELQIQIPQFDRIPKYSDSDSTLINLSLQFFNEMGNCLDEDSDLIITRFHDCIICEEVNEKEKLVWHYSGEFYFGEMILDKQAKIKHGYGIQFKPNVSIYKGYFRHNKKYGNGTVNYYSGQKYKGYWKNDLFHGFGLQICGESRFEGHFNENMKTGFGEEQFKNGDSYQGEYQLDKFSGKGLYRWENGSTYRGDFKKGYMHGQGVWKSSLGDRYEGEYRKNAKSGHGVYFWKNGNVFEGLFENGRKVTGTLKNTRRIKLQKQMSLDESQESFDRQAINQKSGRPDSNSIQNLRSHNSSKIHY